MKVAAKTKAELIKEIDQLRVQLKEAEKRLFTIPEGQDKSSGIMARLILDQASDMIFICDRDGKITRTSIITHRYIGKRIQSKHFDEIVKLRFSSLSPHRKAGFSVSEVLGGKIFRREEVFFQSGDKAFHLLLNASPLTDRHGSIHGCVVTLTDITERTRAVRLSLSKQEDRIEWRIEDNGMGFDLEEILSSAESKRGLGLGSMKERAELSGGTFAIESTKGKGTIVRASWPI